MIFIVAGHSVLHGGVEMPLTVNGIVLLYLIFLSHKLLIYDLPILLYFDANITGLIEYVDLNQSTKVWADHILEACEKERLDTKEQLKKAGYSIQDTAEQVDKIIKHH